MRKNHLPLTTDAFDVLGNVPAEDKLQALQVHMEANLMATLENLKKYKKLLTKQGRACII